KAWKQSDGKKLVSVRLHRTSHRLIPSGRTHAYAHSDRPAPGPGMTAMEEEGQRPAGQEGVGASPGERPDHEEEGEVVDFEIGFEPAKGRRLETTQVLIVTPVWKEGETLVKEGRDVEVTKFWQAQSFAQAKAAAGLKGYPQGAHVVLPNREVEGAELWGLFVPEHKAAFALASKGAQWERVDRRVGQVHHVKVLRIMPWARMVNAEAVADWVMHGFRRVGVQVTNVRVMGTTERAATAQVIGGSAIPTCIFVDGHGCEVVAMEDAPTFYWREQRAERELRTAVVVPARYGVASAELEALASEYPIEYMGTDTFMVPATEEVVKGKNLLVRFKTRKDLFEFTKEVGASLWVGGGICKVLPLRTSDAKFTAYCFKCGAGDHAAKACPRAPMRRRPALPVTTRAAQLIAGTLPAHLREATKRDILTAEALGKSVVPQNRVAYSIVAKMGVAVDVTRPRENMQRVRESRAGDQAQGQEVTALRAEVRELKELLQSALAGHEGCSAALRREGAGPTRDDMTADTIAKMVQAGIEAGLATMHREMVALGTAVRALQGQVARMQQEVGAQGPDDGGLQPDPAVGVDSSPVSSYVTTPRRMDARDTASPLGRKRPSQDLGSSPDRTRGDHHAVVDGRNVRTAAAKKAKPTTTGKSLSDFSFGSAGQRKGMGAGGAAARPPK
ncbi:hypothetical protein HK101_005186, partial [Irineochytrium annulatum]